MASLAELIPAKSAVDVGGVRIAYREAGAGEVVLLLHGIGSAASSWRHQLAGLAGRYRLIAWDAPGYGGSGEVAQPHPVPADYGELAVGLLDALGVARCHLVGHSLGGLIAASIARRHGARLMSLTLSAPAAGYGAKPGGKWPAPVQERLDDLSDLGPAGMAAKRASRMCAPGVRPEILDEARAIMARVRPTGYGRASALLAQGDILADAPDITVRAQVMVGAADIIAPVERCRAIAAAIAGARFELLPGVGHASYLEDPARYNAVLGAFIAGAA